MSNYEKAKRAAAQRFLTFPAQRMIGRFSLEADDAFLYMDFVSTPFRISRETGLCEYAAGGGYQEAGHNAAMTLYDILCYCGEPVSLAGEFVPMESLASTQNASSYFAGQGMFARYEQLFSGRDAALAAACEALGGTKRGKGDVSYEIPVFRDIHALLSFWDADEDFPASLRLYCDKNLTRYMHYETLWYMMGYLLDLVWRGMERLEGGEGPCGQS